MLRPFLAVIPVVACGPSLPGDWSDATPVARLEQTACEGHPYEGTHDERLVADPGSDLSTVTGRELHFRCAQTVEGFQRTIGDAVEVLIQPIDMNPSVVAGCDCLYDVEITLAVDQAPASVTLYRRWDDLNDDNAPVLIGTLPGDGGVDPVDTDGGT